MKIVQVNVWMGRLAKGLMRYIEKEQPDIICMQEVFDSSFTVSYPDRMFTILQLLKEASGLEYEYFSTRYSVDVMDGTVPYGNAILSRFPFRSERTVQIENEIIEHVTPDTEVKCQQFTDSDYRCQWGRVDHC
jgi:endonuclease/exonuclease/phosphatase family metal-dependent hydrolase